MNIEMIEALIVEKDEVLVVKIPHADFTNRFSEIQKALDSAGLANRYIVFSGEVEFTKVKL